MAFLPEEEVWEEGVYQFERTDPLQGGPNGIDNAQGKQLANRTKWLKAAVDAIIGVGFVAAKAAKLAAARKINGVDFDGSADITITANPTEHTHSDITPAGLVLYLARTTAPTGYIKANGAAVSRETYAALFAAIGTTFGVGDGSTTFNLPDLRGEFLRGYDDGRGVDSGRGFGTYQGSSFAAHSHAYNRMGQFIQVSVGGSGNIWDGLGGAETATVGSSETRPRNIALLACIKY